MKSNRQLRVGEEIKKELATLLNFKFEEYRGKFLTVTEARVTSDMHYADVWVMVLADHDTQVANIKQLNADAWRFRKDVAGKMSMRYMPELRFHLDSTLDKAEKIDNLLKSSGLSLDGKPEIE